MYKCLVIESEVDNTKWTQSNVRNYLPKKVTLGDIHSDNLINFSGEVSKVSGYRSIDD